MPPGSSKNPRIVFVADDLGLFPGANEGIAAALATGLIRETSMTVTGAAVEDGAAVARGAGDALGVGLHLAFTEGRALTGAIPGLTRSDGTFRSLPRIWMACRAGAPPRDAVRAEVEAQLDRLEKLVRPAGHLNGHHHVHTFPVIREVVAEVARERSIPFVRVPDEGRATGGALNPKRQVLAGRAKKLRAALESAGAPSRVLPFVGLALFAAPRYAEGFERVVSRLPGPTTEWMTHPRTRDPALAAELSFLTDPDLPGRLSERGVVPSRYSELSPAS